MQKVSVVEDEVVGGFYRNRVRAALGMVERVAASVELETVTGLSTWTGLLTNGKKWTYEHSR